ncbi:uncharacterized protein LOC123879742 isoform X5 [Maniola jurtina]|uniref:uncharacterized protein LOC123879742 isoform X5 n=1 Tax=Maniola jurtina TaxID=191418 RepID=UPI001E689435|nr:uncharacterized protein LOC123879742 isoform X5 [Maniola jurtina]
MEKAKVVVKCGTKKRKQITILSLEVLYWIILSKLIVEIIKNIALKLPKTYKEKLSKSHLHRDAPSASGSSGLSAQEIIIKLHEKNWSYKKIADHLQCSKTMVFNAVRHFDTYQTTSNIPHVPKPRKTSHQDDENIVRLAKQYPFKGSNEIRKEYFGENNPSAISARTIRRRLVENKLHKHGRKARKLVFNQTESAGATQQPSTEELQSSTTPIQPSTSTFGEIKYQTSTSTAEGVQYQPTTSRHEQLPYQPSKYSMACENKKIALEEVILIKEEITEEEKNQCRLCLSVGRRMQELGEYALLYRKLLFENNFQNTTIPSFMYQILACWECHAELRRIDRFQDKVRRANNAFETNQNRNCESLSNLSAILIGEYKKSEAEEAEDAEEAEEEQESEKLSRVEECAQEIKEEAVEVEVEETSLPDPLEFNQEDRKAGWDEENLDIRNEPNISAPTQKAVKRTPPEPKMPQNVPKRPKLGQTLTSGPRRPKLDGSGPKTAQEEENNLKFTEETSPEAIFAKVQIEINELVKILDERRSIESFRNMRFKCDSCILGFTNHNRLLEHNRNFHNQEFGSCECAICERRFGDERRLSAHYRNHFVKFVCKLCNYECYTKTGQAIHFKRHKSATQAASSLLRPIKTYQRASASESSCESST